MILSLEVISLLSFPVCSTNAVLQVNYSSNKTRNSSKRSKLWLAECPGELHRITWSPCTQDLGWWDEVNNVGLKAHFIASQLAVPMMLNSSSVRAPLQPAVYFTASSLAHMTLRFYPCSFPDVLAHSIPCSDTHSSSNVLHDRSSPHPTV